MQRKYLDELHIKASTDLNAKSKWGDAASSVNLSQYLKGKVTSDAAELNAWFAENDWPGMDITIAPNGLGVGSIFDLLVDWQNVGKKYSVYIDQVRYEGVKMDKSASLNGYQLQGYDYPMFELATRQDGWRVFLVETDKSYTGMDLTTRAVELMELSRQPYDFRTLQFPQVDFEADVNIKWMEGMKVEGGLFSIDEAIKKVRLRLDDKGARAQSAVAMITRSLPMGVYSLERPFFVIFWHEGLTLAPFVAISANDSWKKAA
mmetsp:Transcript_12932/g.19697  ORF Transcript_12932/g.19697 Transcript_12932/m.19697 type:complete len:261 (-) Transcript_12932:596-1378(-)|eukprot:CAMPEP_0196809352 /NCGR_PEP_ID=MMETSP1362-20130617/9298_1 /TAXON_ID=163516 /ORGANISM="Leptocylindrus danicus, Strain CCMP1856" /LENGTH=260 /DNA_ID=CAMNT_0042184025 /DNA_START=381 /DNA_END=1163 /DNA_ORIENTATION=+